MRARFYIDPATGSPHISGHDVTEAEAVEVLERPDEDRNSREASRVALGQTASRRYLRVIYVPDEELVSVFVITAYDPMGKPLAAFRKRRKAAMNQTKFPEGWDESIVRRALAQYKEQSEEDALAEDEAGVRSSGTVMAIPHELVPEVRELIARRHR